MLNELNRLLDIDENRLLLELSDIIDNGQKQIATQVNSGVVIMFWQVGTKVNGHVLDNQRASYGKQIVVTLSRQLQEMFGKNFEEKNLRRILQFSSEFQDFENVVTLSRHLSWSHFLAIIPLRTAEAKMFYATQSAKQHCGS